MLTDNIRFLLALGPSNEEARASDSAATKLLRNIARIKKLAKDGWVDGKLAAYYGVSEIEFRKFAKANKIKLAVPDKVISVKRVTERPATKNALARVQQVLKLCDQYDAYDIICTPGQWFLGSFMSSRQGKTKYHDHRQAKLAKILKAIQKVYPITRPKKIYRACMLKLNSSDITNAQLLRLTRFTVSDKPISSWTEHPLIAEKFYNDIHSSHGRGKTKAFDWVVLEAKPKEAVVNVDTVLEFYRDLWTIRKSDFLKNLNYLNASAVDYYMKHMESAFIQKQREIVCITGPDLKMPATIYKIMRRGNLVK